MTPLADLLFVLHLLAQWLLLGLAVVATSYVVIYLLLQLAMLLFAWSEIRRQRAARPAWHPRQVLEAAELPAISVVIPAYNESLSIVRTVRSILASGYPALSVVVVNDGSRDATLSTLIEAFDLRPAAVRCEAVLPTQPVRMVLESPGHPALRIVDKLNGGKADALNAGINHASGELVCATDADVLFDRWALFHLARPFLADATTVASTGVIRLLGDVGSGAAKRLPDRWLERFQALEYLRAFTVGRLFFNYFSSHVIISGAFGLFRRATLFEIGGYQPFAIGEDIEIVTRLHRHLRKRGKSYRIAFVTDAVCYTEAPHSVGELGRQRTRWHQGLLTTLRLHRGLLFRRQVGAIGWLALPYFLLFELLAPVIELAGWAFLPVGWLMGMIAGASVLPFLLASVILGTAVSLTSIAIDNLELRYFKRPRETLVLAVCAALEHFGYHQLTLWFRLRAFPRFYKSIHLRSGWRSPRRAAA